MDNLDPAAQIRVLSERLDGLRREYNLRLESCEKTERVLVDRIKQERLISDERRNADHAALHLQATEYERRLTDLNHAHTTAMENWARSLPREIFSQFEKENTIFKDDINVQISDLNVKLATTVQWTSIGGVILVIIAFTLNYFVK